MFYGQGTRVRADTASAPRIGVEGGKRPVNEAEVRESIRCFARCFGRAISAVLCDVLLPLVDKVMALFAPAPTKPAYRPPTRPRQARPWELRGQAVGLNVTPTWQRCPQRHWGREGKDRWRGERVA